MLKNARRDAGAKEQKCEDKARRGWTIPYKHGQDSARAQNSHRHRVRDNGQHYDYGESWPDHFASKRSLCCCEK
jgi:hypothetical protein